MALPIYILKFRKYNFSRFCIFGLNLTLNFEFLFSFLGWKDQLSNFKIFQILRKGVSEMSDITHSIVRNNKVAPLSALKTYVTDYSVKHSDVY